ncbi:Cu(I)-responsive transcriptional regulator [uncultured Gilvimarinus sp.]|uniref:Cu(I)-responsive transcriptional regulator n=1 Tax=uncultured Gilvimarinus sp. TaxID=1689143 RepID=UPI0030EC44FC|tara:strand:- start:2275 stop:2724 length:450 start_codon:yes stop_codon:yes gene_type:complete
MKIGEVARETGLTAKAIRYYESQGLVKSRRRDNGYRDYGGDHIKQLTLLARARRVGFSLQECAELLALFGDTERHSADVKRAVQHKIAQLDEQLNNLTRMRDTLEELAQRCQGDEQAQCAILNDLSAANRPMPFTLLGDTPNLPEDSHE